MKNLRAWFIATRPWSFVMTASSITAATVYTYYLTGILNLPFFIATLLGVTLLHASANVLNDYYDTKRGVDIPGAPTTQYRPHPLITGFTTPEKLRNFALTLLAAGLFFAFILAIYRTLIVILLALSGVFFVIGYSGLLGLKYKALGELSVFLSWGPLMWLGTYYVQTGLLDLQPVLASIPIGLLVAAVLTANNLRDIEFDKSRGATTLEVLLGREKGLRFFAYFEVYLAYMVLVVLTALRLVPLTALLPILTLPSAFRLVKMFQKEIPAAADPMTAKLVQDFAIWYILGLALGLVIRF